MLSFVHNLMLWEHTEGQGAYVRRLLITFSERLYQKFVQKIDLLPFKLELRGLNYQTPFMLTVC